MASKLSSFTAKYLSALTIATLFAVSTLSTGVVSAEEQTDAKVGEDAVPEVESARPEVTIEHNNGRIETAPDTCYSGDYPAEFVYDSELISIRKQLRWDLDTPTRVKIFLQNNGNTPWYSTASSCPGERMSLHTTRGDGERSYLFAEGLEGWEDLNGDGQAEGTAIQMDQYRVDPGQIASFTFWGNAGSEEEVYKQYLVPILGDHKMENDEIELEVVAGNISTNSSEIREQMLYARSSGPVSHLDVNAERRIHVDISDQEAWLTLGGVEIHRFPVSTGTYATPTPIGEYEIHFKQDVRVSGGPVAYVMPNFMWFKDGGYGFHSLPSVRGGNGSFWRESERSIGRRASHGCVRMPDADSDFTYAFAQGRVDGVPGTGTKVTIQN